MGVIYTPIDGDFFDPLPGRSRDCSGRDLLFMDRLAVSGVRGSASSCSPCITLAMTGGKVAERLHYRHRAGLQEHCEIVALTRD